jgi:DNA-binding MarR family transcriptional regulator
MIARTPVPNGRPFRKFCLVSKSLLDELKQTRPFNSTAEEALLSIVRTNAVLLDEFDRLLRPYRITTTQYNVLRILRGSEPAGLCRNELRDRMLTRMPDVTRLLDRMQDAGLVTRARTGADRRMVSTRITKKGLTILAELDPIVKKDQQRYFQGVDPRQLTHLISLLGQVRETAAEDVG